MTKPPTTILYTSADVHAAIRRILEAPSAGERRVVVVAYVGASAEAYLPAPNGLELVCSQHPARQAATRFGVFNSAALAFDLLTAFMPRCIGRAVAAA